MTHEPRGSRQLPFDLGHRPAVGRDDLFVGDANRAAVALVDAWPNWPSPVAVLVGPEGSGKSHLAHIWQRQANAVIAEARALQPAAESGRPVLLEDADSGAVGDTDLFHLVNAVRQTGSHLLLTASDRPAAWTVTLPDLASRLKEAAFAQLEPPDEAMLAAVITKLFADRQVEVEPHVVQYVVRRMERSFQEAQRLVDALDRAALEAKSRVTRALAASVLERMRPQSGQSLD